LKIFVAYLISKAIGFSSYVASFGAYIISQWKSGQGKGRKLAMGIRTREG
jgi:hypothetical protein